MDIFANNNYMDISSLKGKIPNEILESMKNRGIDNLTEPQALAIKAGILDMQDIIVCSPTASGKTLIAEIALINIILRTNKKAIYVAPLRALASEKYTEFKEAYPYIKSVISIGDLDSNDQWLSEYQLIFTSTEKLDSLIRHGADWLYNVGCIVFDEIHMIGDISRGPTLELLVTKLKLQTNLQIIGLSATIGNPQDIASWLDAKLVTSNFRPIPLKKGIVYKTQINYYNENQPSNMNGISSLPESRILEDTLFLKKQILIFYSTRRNTEAGAKRLSQITKKTLSVAEQEALVRIATNVLEALSNPTEQCKRLYELIKDGIAFHHAGLLNAQRSIIEDAFKNNMIKCLCATTTLSLGINMPAHTVLVKDLHRYDGNGSSMIGVNEVMQLFGRAGRPKYDTEGRAFVIASNMDMAQRLKEKYMEAELDPIESNLGIAPILRTHILAFIASGEHSSLESINNFLSKSFYSHQYGNMSIISSNVRRIISDLIDWGFVNEDEGRLVGTRIGKRVSELYIDPLSARWIIESLGQKRDSISNLFMITNTVEMRPYVKASDDSLTRYMLYVNKNEISELLDRYDNNDYGAYDPQGAFSTAMMLHEWIDEVGDDELVKNYSTTPGAIYNKITNAQWLLYSATELAKMLKISSRDITNISVRMRYGIKEELLDLVRLSYIGRVRARMLFNAGIESVSAIKQHRDKTINILGKEIAEKVFTQI